MTEILNDCNALIVKELESLDRIIGKQNNTHGHSFQKTQVAIEAVVADQDKNIDKILSQQSYLKMLLDKDSRVKSLKAAISASKEAIEQLRKECNDFNVKSIKERQELLEAQAKEIDKFQMQQLRSIAEDQRRHQQLLEHRRQEIVKAKKEIENEEKNREAYLADVEKNLNNTLQTRRNISRGVGFPTATEDGSANAAAEPDHIELETVDEYAPYGPTTTCPAAPKPKRGGTGRGRGRRARGK